MRAKLIEAVRSLWRKKTTVTLELDGLIEFEKWKDTELAVDIDVYRKKRSLSANAYFHVLSDKKKSFEVKDFADISEKDYYTVINNIELVKEKGDKYKESENG